MKHSNISIFVPHVGCPHRCSFCDQRIISGSVKPVRGEDVRRICSEAINEIGDKKNTQIAFFGGSFTAIDRNYMTELLEAAGEFVGEGKFSGIRISTRPDFINNEILKLLKKYKVSAIELGAQSLDNIVLAANERGHTAEDVFEASSLIRQHGFELGLQIIPGLYKSSRESEKTTVEGVLKISPQTVRIYPIVVIEGTRLSEYYKSGKYTLMPFEEMVTLCADMMIKFQQKGIKVIKCGLHASDGVEGERIAGFYHPAFRELCQGMIYRKNMEKLLEGKRGSFELFIGKRFISQALGQKKSNIAYFKERGLDIKLSGREDIPIYKVLLNSQEKQQ